MKKFLLYLLVAVTIQSCAIVHTPGFNSGYKRLTAEEQHKICFVSSVDEIPDHNDGRIIVVRNFKIGTYDAVGCKMRGIDSSLLSYIMEVKKEKEAIKKAQSDNAP